MRVVRFAGPGPDDNHVIVETADGGEQFSLYVDVALRDATRSDLPRLPHHTPEPEMTISPRDIQMRVRAGESPQALAESHAVSLERVMRFAGAVLEERMRIADEARRCRARRSTTEGQTVIFGEAVDQRFSAHGISPGEITWDARRRDDGQWIVVAGWLGGEEQRSAEWVFHRTSRTVAPLDDTAADLLSDRPIRPVQALEDAPRPVLTVAPALAPGVVAFPAMPDAFTGPLPERDDVFDQNAHDPDAARPAALDHRTWEPQPAQARTAPASGTSAPAEFEALPLPLSLHDHEPAGSPAKRTTVGTPTPRVTNLGVAHRDDEPAAAPERHARPKVPAWDDIMLGVRRKTDS